MAWARAVVGLEHHTGETPHQVQHLNFCTVQSIAKLPNRVAKMDVNLALSPIFHMLPLNRHYNIRNGVVCEHYSFNIKKQQKLDEVNLKLCFQIISNRLETAAVAEWYRYRIVSCLVTSSSPVPLKTRRVGQRCTLNLSRAETSSRWCGVEVRRGGCQLRCRLCHLTMVQNYLSVAKSPRVAEQCVVNIQSSNQPADLKTPF
ncbi:uncharacterized protein TNCV_1896681 [Trichonephila clavipes]|nr:uncharacterized protein TNCV_1896681 [Trichonephila clavipes]